MITTVKEYCKMRGVTRQFVYEYVRKGKFELREMPAFVEVEGNKIVVGMEKVLIVPDAFTAKTNDKMSFSKLDDAAFVQYLTDNSELQKFYSAYLKMKDKEARLTFKKEMYESINSRDEAEKMMLTKALDEANIKLMQRMVSMGNNMKDVLKKDKMSFAE
jgi:predicted mannosyl-3-phosphoglycerate phosphatase (HAD superfamily)